MEQLEKATMAQLRKLCFITGTKSAGLKSQVLDNIRLELPKKCVLERRIPNNGSNFQVVSVDMGIKNFAYTRLELDKSLPFNRVPKVTEWKKLDVNSWAEVSNDSAFEPGKYAEICNKLVNDILLPVGEPFPDAILIERQRNRSTSGKNISEWIFRVNMFEAMLHAFIYSRMLQNGGKVKTEIVQMSPQRMGNYWKPEGSETKLIDSKRYRLEFVEKLLSDCVHAKKDAKLALDSSFALVRGPEGRRRTYLNQIVDSIKKEVHDFGREKGDDLVDSLLHALAWIEWQGNRTVLKLEFVSGVDDALKKAEELYDQHVADLDFLKGLERRRYSKTKKPHVIVAENTKDESWGTYEPGEAKAMVNELEDIKETSKRNTKKTINKGMKKNK